MQTIGNKTQPVLIDNRLVRSNALLTTFVLFICLFVPRTVGIALLLLQAFAFSTSIWFPKMSPYPFLSRRLFLFKLFKKGEGEHRKPIRFSQQVGLLFVLPSLILLMFGFSAGLVLVAFCFTASALNAFFGLCIACKLYPRVRLAQYRIHSRLLSLFYIQIR